MEIVTDVGIIQEIPPVTAVICYPRVVLAPCCGSSSIPMHLVNPLLEQLFMFSEGSFTSSLGNTMYYNTYPFFFLFIVFYHHMTKHAGYFVKCYIDVYDLKTSLQL